MIDLYFWSTPNSLKVLIALEELNYTYNLIPIDINKEENKTLEYLTMNPTGKLPTIIDDQVILCESNAILQYLAEKKDNLIPSNENNMQSDCSEWLNWQNSNFVQCLDQKEKVLKNEVFQILEDHLRNRRYICGEEFTIADISLFPWIDIYKDYRLNINHFPHVKEWYFRLYNKKTIQKAKCTAKHFSKNSYFTDCMKKFIKDKNPDKNKTS